MKTLYDVLGVPRSATDEAIRIAFRRAAKACHPDLNAGDPAAEQQFRQIISAYEILKTPQQRALYDQHLAANDGHQSGARGAVWRFAQSTVAGLLSGSIVALAVWLSLSVSNREETPKSPQASLISATEIRPPAVRQADAADDSSGHQDDDGSRASGGAAVALDGRRPDDPPERLQSASNPPSTADHPASHVLLAREWEQVLARGDAMAIWQFIERNPDALESEIARGKLIALIDSAEDVSLLQTLSAGATEAIAKRAQQRLARLHELAAAKEDSRVVSGNAHHANDSSPSKDTASHLTRGEHFS